LFTVSSNDSNCEAVRKKGLKKGFGYFEIRWMDLGFRNSYFEKIKDGGIQKRV
jgi:hypothetical protein